MASVASEIVLPVVDEGLGNSSYLVDLAGGQALAIDPSCDVRRLDQTAERLGLAVSVVAETHLHADFVSGATRLGARDNATILGSADGAREFPHVGLRDGDEHDLGGLRLQAWATPGHTSEHLSYLLLDGADVIAVFTGGSLIVGAAARTDLSGVDRTELLARAQYRSLRRLAELPDSTPVYPTHGAGSFCSSPPGADRTTTIGRERATNPLMQLADEDRFVSALLNSLGTYPPYFLQLGEVNRHGPSVVSTVDVPMLSVADVQGWCARGAVVVDARPVRDYAQGHVPGALSIELRPAFATWLGWMVASPQTPLIIVRNHDQDLDEITWQARKVGYDSIVGEFAAGIDAWRRAGQAVATTSLVDPQDVIPEEVLDIRQLAEYAAGHIPNTMHVELGSIESVTSLDGRTVMMCGHGERAATAASVLERLGYRGLGIVLGGPDDWSACMNAPLVDGA